MNLRLEANVFALNGAEYLGQMGMSYDEWHWASRTWFTFCRCPLCHSRGADSRKTAAGISFR